MDRHKARIEAMKALVGGGESAEAQRVNQNYTGLLTGFDKIGQQFESMEKAVRRLLNKHTTPLR